MAKKREYSHYPLDHHWKLLPLFNDQEEVKFSTLNSFAILGWMFKKWKYSFKRYSKPTLVEWVAKFKSKLWKVRFMEVHFLRVAYKQNSEWLQ